MTVHLIRHGDLAELRLDNPAKLNALTVAMLEALAAHLDTLEREGARGLLLTATGNRAFCTGADINAWAGLSPAEFARTWVRGGHRIFDRLARLACPSIAVLQGHAFGGGLELAAACDIRVMAPGATLALPETGVGIVPGWSGTQRLTRLLPEPVVKEILALNIKGVYDIKEYKRLYPEGEAAAHIVGFTNVEDQGQEGVELVFQNQLAGKPGARRVIKDRLGRVVESVGETIPPEDGMDLQLSVDSKVQFFAYQKLREAVLEHKAKAGSVVVLDAQTGEILALANYPSYSPDKRVNLSGEQLRNRALTDTFEPGSTMKPFAVALALEKGLVKPETPIQTAPGRITITGSTITDAHPHGVLTVNEVIQKSSNVGTVKMAMQLQPREMWEMFAQVGFGQKPQLPFPGVVSGRLRPYKTWRPIEQATMSYGYGISGSLFQVARAYTVVARDGEVVPATLMKAEGQVQGMRVISPQNAKAMRKMLQMAAGPGGTAQKAQKMGYSVGGKTGTAHKQEGKGYAGKKYRGFFVGMAPIEAPRIVVAVMIDEPTNGRYYGGDVAAPVFSQTVQQTLRLMGVQPDMAVKPQIVAQTVEESF